MLYAGKHFYWHFHHLFTPATCIPMQSWQSHQQRVGQISCGGTLFFYYYSIGSCVASLLACTVGLVRSYWYIVAHGVLDLFQHRAFHTGRPLRVAVGHRLNVVFIVGFSIAKECGTKGLDLRFCCTRKHTSAKKATAVHTLAELNCVSVAQMHQCVYLTLSVSLCSIPGGSVWAETWSHAAEEGRLLLSWSKTVQGIVPIRLFKTYLVWIVEDW